MFERLTERARKVMALANQEAQRYNHEYLGTEHILLGLIRDGRGVGANVLRALNVNLSTVCKEIDKLVKPGPDAVTLGKLPQTPKAMKVIEYAIMEARNLSHNYVGTEHLLLGLLREADCVAAQVLVSVGVDLSKARAGVLATVGTDEPVGAEPVAAAAPAAPVLPAEAIEDSRLRIVVECWPKLPLVLREGIVAMVRDAAKY
jgi:ATP-dependent Clp protease ATP-binding subunit ClpC